MTRRTRSSSSSASASAASTKTTATDCLSPGSSSSSRSRSTTRRAQSRTVNMKTNKEHGAASGGRGKRKREAEEDAEEEEADRDAAECDGEQPADAKSNVSDSDADDGSNDDDDEMDEGSVEFSGECDPASGAWLRGELRHVTSKRLAYRGEFKDGNKHGKGELFFPDGATLKGRFEDDEPSGFGVYTGSDGSTIEGNYRAGLLCGEVIERDEDGNETFRGEYVDSQRHGKGCITLPDGGKLIGRFVEGEFDGDHNRYVYPPAFGEGIEACLKGKWREGVMLAAKFYIGDELQPHPDDPNAMHAADRAIAKLTGATGQPMDVTPEPIGTNSVPPSRSSRPRRSAAIHPTSSSSSPSPSSSLVAVPPLPPPIYRFDESTSRRISSDPLLSDPFESLLVEARPSTIPDSGEGLFARRHLPAGVVVTWYNGTRERGSRSERRRWDMNSNTIALIDDDPTQRTGIDIDVAPKWSFTSTYKASLAHKCNHSFDETQRNAMYDMALHPRFGLIKCIRTTKSIKPNEELYVDYGYALRIHPKSGRVLGKSGPEWYRKGYEAHRMKQLTPDSNEPNGSTSTRKEGQDHHGNAARRRSTNGQHSDGTVTRTRTTSKRRRT